MISTQSRRKFLIAASATMAAPTILRHAHAAGRPIKVAWIRQFAPAAVVQKAADLANAAGQPVELINFNRGLDAMIAMQKGDVIAANCVLGYSQVCLALSQDVDLTIVSGATRQMNGIVINPKTLSGDQVDQKNMAYVGPEPWKQLVGKKVGTARGSVPEFLLRSYLQAHQLDFEKDIQFVDLKTNGDQVLALQQGAIDVACLVEPSATQARVSGFGVLLTHPYDAGGFALLNAPLVVRTDALSEYREELQALVNAHVQAVKIYQDDLALWVTDTSKVAVFDKDTITHLLNPAALQLDPKYWANAKLDLTLPVGDVQQYAKSYYDNHFMQKDVSDQIPSHIDYSMLSNATGLTKEQLGG